MTDAQIFGPNAWSPSPPDNPGWTFFPAYSTYLTAWRFGAWVDASDEVVGYALSAASPWYEVQRWERPVQRYADAHVVVVGAGAAGDSRIRGYGAKGGFSGARHVWSGPAECLKSFEFVLVGTGGNIEDFSNGGPSFFTRTGVEVEVEGITLADRSMHASGGRSGANVAAFIGGIGGEEADPPEADPPFAGPVRMRGRGGAGGGILVDEDGYDGGYGGGGGGGAAPAPENDLEGGGEGGDGGFHSGTGGGGGGAEPGNAGGDGADGLPFEGIRGAGGGGGGGMGVGGEVNQNRGGQGGFPGGGGGGAGGRRGGPSAPFSQGGNGGHGTVVVILETEIEGDWPDDPEPVVPDPPPTDPQGSPFGWYVGRIPFGQQSGGSAT